MKTFKCFIFSKVPLLICFCMPLLFTSCSKHPCCKGKDKDGHTHEWDVPASGNCPTNTEYDDPGRCEAECPSGKYGAVTAVEVKCKTKGTKYQPINYGKKGNCKWKCPGGDIEYGYEPINCPDISGKDSDGDGILDDGNSDGDTEDKCTGGNTKSCDDNCSDPNPDQKDDNKNGIGDICEKIDSDDDGILDDGNSDGDTEDKCTGGNKTNCDDNCREKKNPDQADSDNDGIGNACPQIDSDGDGILDDGSASGSNTDKKCKGGNKTGCDDNCINKPNPNQEDKDNDGIGDACEMSINELLNIHKTDACITYSPSSEGDAQYAKISIFINYTYDGADPLNVKLNTTTGDYSRVYSTPIVFEEKVKDQWAVAQITQLSQNTTLTLKYDFSVQALAKVASSKQK